MRFCPDKASVDETDFVETAEFLETQCEEFSTFRLRIDPSVGGLQKSLPLEWIQQRDTSQPRQKWTTPSRGMPCVISVLILMQSIHIAYVSPIDKGENCRIRSNGHATVAT
jgi:hypothetical protein